jgi:hypothetical protein
MSMGVEYLRREILTGLLPEIAYRIHISDDDRSYIKEIKNQLVNNPGFSFILYFNHISYNDPLLAAYVVQQIDPQHTRHLIAPASYSHTIPDNPANRGFSFMISEAKRCGIEIVRVIQAYQVDNPKYGYTKDQAQITYRAWMRRLRELQLSNTPTGCLISPEGHRSDDGILGAGESGILATGRFLAPVVYIPVGISYTDDYKRDNFNIGKKLNLSIGNTIVQHNPKEYPNLNNVMLNLAMALPSNMRGEWLE